MTVLLDIAQQELDAARARVAALEQIVGGLRALSGAGEGVGHGGAPSDSLAPPPAPGKRDDAGALPRAADGHRGALPPVRQSVLDAIAAKGGWVKVDEIAAAIGISAVAVRSHMKVLVKTGSVEAKGATKARRYRIAEVNDQAPAPEPAEPPNPAPPAAEQVAERRQDAIDGERLARRVVVAALEQHGPLSFGQLTDRTRMGRGRLLTTLQELARELKVTQDDQRRWMTTAQRDAQVAALGRRGTGGGGGQHMTMLRRRVVAAITTNPRAFTEQQLAARVHADREEVAEICGELLTQHEIVLRSDGTYSPMTREPAHA